MPPPNPLPGRFRTPIGRVRCRPALAAPRRPAVRRRAVAVALVAMLGAAAPAGHAQTPPDAGAGPGAPSAAPRSATPAAPVSPPAAPAVVATPDDPEYQAALTDLEAGRTARAIERLQALAARRPSDLGVRLDLAIAHCLAGEPDAAGRLFLTLEARPDLPPAIAEVIAYYRGGQCRPRGPLFQGYLLAGGGYARNLNFAPLTGLIPLPELGILLQLADPSRPRNAPFGQVEAGVLRALTDDGRWTVGALAQGIAYHDASDFNLGFAQVNLGWRAAAPTWRAEAQAAASHLQLGGHAHLNAVSGSASALRPVDAHWSFGGAMNAGVLNYTQLSAFDARVLEMRARARWQDARLRITGDAGWQYDWTTNERPGGNRSGPVAQLWMTWAPLPGQLVDVLYRYLWARDTDPYAPAFFGPQRRSQNLQMLLLNWRFQLREHLAARLEYRFNGSSDEIPLFDYRSYTMGAAIEWTFGR